MKNRLNDLDSKSYMKFLKSWFFFQDNTPADFVRFFTKQLNEQGQPNTVGLWGFHPTLSKELTATGRHFIDLADGKQSNELAYALFDLRTISFSGPDDTLHFFQKTILPLLPALRSRLQHKGYISFFVSMYHDKHSFFPIAWQLAQWLAQWFEMKDEKIGCLEQMEGGTSFFPMKGQRIIYALNFRNTLQNEPSIPEVDYPQSSVFNQNNLLDWFILKPPRRKEKVKLHPAKFPEVLINEFIKTYSQPGDIVFDPMAGTGSTLMAALENGRRAYGSEITPHFAQIATDRLETQQAALGTSCPSWHLIEDDAYNFDQHPEYPRQFDYIVTSPPYWDMLNMKGAETQRYRRQKGLNVNYSDLDSDLGNCSNYNIFLAKLMRLYKKVFKSLKPGGHVTIIVKNIKKKGVIYPFAWDLVESMSGYFDLTALQFWLQDDIRLAPYGYGNAWVSNTFHQYCLTLKKRAS